MPEPTDRYLIAAARRGDAEAFGLLYRRHHALVLAFFLARTGHAGLAADLTAETFASTLTSCPGYRQDVPPARWLFAIARRVLADSRKSGIVDSSARRRLGLRTLELDDGDLERITALRDLLPSVTAARGAEQLAEGRRQALRARILDELEHPRPPTGLRHSHGIAHSAPRSRPAPRA